MKSIGIPIPTLRRLPLYYQQLLDASRQGKSFISSVELGKATGSAPEQVRKDLSFLAGQGKSRVGYETKKLAGIIEDYLGLQNNKKAVLVGAGNLGRALALYPGFAQFGLKIVALYDNDSSKIGQMVGNLQVMPVERMPEHLEKNHTCIGIITTSPGGAQEVAETMVNSGIRAIWNFSTVHLHVPEEVMVRNVDLSLELAVISHYISSLGLHKNIIPDRDLDESLSVGFWENESK